MTFRFHRRQRLLRPTAEGSSGPPRRRRTHNNLSCLVSPTPAARRLSLPRGPPAGRLLDRIVHIEYTVFVQRAEPKRSRHLARLDLHFPRSPLGPAQAAFAVKPSTIRGTIPGPKAGVRPSRAHFFGRVAERQQTPNDGTSRCGKATADSVTLTRSCSTSAALTHLPKPTSPDRLLRAQPPSERCRNANANVDRSRSRNRSATEARHTGNRPPRIPRAPGANRRGLGHDADDHAIFLLSPLSAFATHSLADCPPPLSHAAPCPSPWCSPSHGLAAPAIPQPRSSLHHPALVDTTCPAVDHDRSLLLAWRALTNAPTPIHISRRRWPRG